MKVKLVSYSQPTREFFEKGMEGMDDICRFYTSEKLIDFLVKNKNWSPLEMVNVCMEIETTRDISRKILRYKSFSFQEFNQLEFVIRPGDSKFPLSVWEEKQKELIEKAKETYDWAILNGIPKDQARCILPEGNTLSRIHVNGSLRSWIDYIDSNDNSLSKECSKVISKIFSIKDHIPERISSPKGSSEMVSPPKGSSEMVSLETARESHANLSSQNAYADLYITYFL